MFQEDVNGEKLTVKKWWIFGADFSRFTQSFSRFIRDINAEKKHLVIDMSFFTVSFSRFAPSRVCFGDRPPGLQFASESEHFRRATRKATFLQGILKVKIDQARLKFSSEIENFKRD